MIDKIKGVGGPDPLKGVYDKKVEKYKGKSKVERESLELSGKGFLESVLEKSEEIPEVRQELVEQLKKAIESGNYVVDVKNIVKRMLGGE
ncbi:MAG: flagellar biosynthesis anti-sigma factor FlgM [Thermotogaceae bacterium]|nr:flagellar biosynthesis anti-sigma factor FlgM [Thermotogaceae bacterium]